MGIRDVGFITNQIKGMKMNRKMLVAFSTVMYQTFIATICLGLAAAMFQGTLHAQAGQLDPTFGTGGKVDITLADGATAFNGAVTLQTNGQIVLAGTVQPNNGLGQGGLVRYNGNGSLDTTFGTGGFAVDNFPNSFESGNLGVAIQSDGAIVTGGFVYPQGLGVVRFNSNGIPDTSFGTGGVAIATTNQEPSVGAVLLQKDGKILVAGGLFLARVTTDGSLDTSFGTAGIARLVDSANSAVLQSNGKILIGGGETISRYNSNGTLDTTFGLFGRAPIVSPVTALALQSNGKIVALGTLGEQFPFNAPPKGGAFLVTRYNSNGAVDSTFGTHGGTLVSFSTSQTNAVGMAVVIQPNGDIVVAGQVVSSSAKGQYAVARLIGTGVLDTTFGAAGVLTTSFGNIDNAFALALQSNGDIVAAGVDETAAGNGNFVLARYLGQ
jgi:uncharacterized delta-60 repeat protein